MKIGNCDNCCTDDRYVKAGYDSFDVHVVDICFYGCGDPRNIPNIISMPCNSKPKDRIKLSEADKKRHMQVLEGIFEDVFGEAAEVEPTK